MSTAAIIQQAKADGVNLSLSPSGTIKATGKPDAIAKWSPLLREKKSPILARLRLEALACEFNHPVDDLLDWYQFDLEDLGEFPLERVQAVVTEYLSNIATYRGTGNSPPCPRGGERNQARSEKT